jgi:hypothetical protein
MMYRWKADLVAGLAIFTSIGAGALAQTAPPPPFNQPAGRAVGQVSLYDPQQLPAQRGQLQQFTLTPRGDIDGLILSDGTEVKTPPHLSTEIAYSVRPGDTVTVHGLHAAALPLVQAVSITDDTTGRTVVDGGPPSPGLTEVQGRVRTTLHGPQGEVNGALLEDGTVLRLPPYEAYRFATLLQPGQVLVAEGTAVANAIGTVSEVWQLGASRDQLSPVEGPPEPGRDRRPPPPRGPGSVPPGPPRPQSTIERLWRSNLRHIANA